MSLNVYTTCSPIVNGCALYSDSGLTTPVANGKYSDGTNCFTVVSGIVTITSACGDPEPTPTATATSTPTASPTPGVQYTYDVSVTEPEVCTSPVGLLLYSFSAFGVGVTLYTNNSIPLTPVTGYNYIKDPNSGTIYNLNPSTGVVGSATGNVC